MTERPPRYSLFSPPSPSLRHTRPHYPTWDLPERAPVDGADCHRITAEDLGISLSSSAKSLNFQQYDEDLTYRVIQNDQSRQALLWLAMAKNIFRHELTQMPEHYISRLVFNEQHRTVILLKDGTVLGGICFRPFYDCDFAEIAFCAVSTQQQIRGYGSHIMAHVKAYLQAIGIHNILTYADNTAIGYFKRQGFTLEINFDPNIWRRCIKDYQGATLIHCSIDPNVDYLRIHDILDQQKRLASSLLPDMDLATVNEWPVVSFRGIQIGGQPQIDVKSQMLQIIGKLRLHSRAWPFQKPVTKDEAPNYSDYVKTPMDLTTLEANVNGGKYGSIEQFADDCRLIFTHCMKYNTEDTVYHRSAKEVEKYFEQLMGESAAALKTWSLRKAEGE
jgi:histone acetyltransferase